VLSTLDDARLDRFGTVLALVFAAATVAVISTHGLPLILATFGRSGKFSKQRRSGELSIVVNPELLLDINGTWTR
jgi:hypothetical protein